MSCIVAAHSLIVAAHSLCQQCATCDNIQPNALGVSQHLECRSISIYNLNLMAFQWNVAQETCAATHCNTLQHTATHCNTLQHTATHCNTLQHTATYCNTLQHTAAHCNTLQHTATRYNRRNMLQETMKTRSTIKIGEKINDSPGAIGCNLRMACWH